MSNDYKEYLKKLTAEDKKYIEQLKDDTYKINKIRIKEGIESDRNHLMMMNLVANLFQHGTNFNEKYGYRVISIEPFIEEGEKNFDLAILNRMINTLILVECKYSISNISKELNHIEKAIKISKEKIKKYEKLLGNKIDKIEHVICVDGNIASSVTDKILEKNLPLITWGCSLSKAELRLHRMKGKEEHGDAFLNNRLHYNDDFNKELYEGVTPLGGITKLFKFIPSSNTATILTEINITIKEMMEKNEVKKDEIDFTNIYHILEKELIYSTLNEKNVDEIVCRVIEKAKIKEIYELSDIELNKNGDIRNQKLKFKISSISGKKIQEKTEENYIELNAIHKAEEEAITKLEGSGRLPSMDKFLPDENNRT